MADPICDLPLVAINNDACAAQAYDYGQQVRTILYQEESGVAPNLIGTKATPATLSVVQAAINADAPDKLFVLKDIAGGAMPAATDTTISGNDVPGGGTRLVSRTNTFTGYLDLITPELVDAVNKMILRGGTYRTWFADNNSYLQGYATGATLTFGGLERAGINNATNRIAVTVTYTSKVILPLGFAPIAGINSLTNA
jgi:hypothetical protein